MFENNSVTVEYAQIMNDGWLAVYRYGVQREELLGYTFVEAGEHEDIEIELTSNYFVKARERLQVILHLDANKNKVFDWNDENTIDLPLKDGEREVSRLFNLILDGDYWITVEDQPLRSGPFEDLIDIINLNLESIQYLIESEKVWIVAYNDMDGSPGEEVGTSNPIIVTNHDKETIYIYGRVEVGDILWLVLHNDGDSAPGTMVYDTENEEYVMTFITIL